jgi:hypothetical protein
LNCYASPARSVYRNNDVHCRHERKPARRIIPFAAVGKPVSSSSGCYGFVCCDESVETPTIE